MLAALELAVYRLAVPGLKPTNPIDAPPLWHTGLSYAGLFLSYFASILAVGIILRQLILFARGDHPYWKPFAYALVISAAAFATYAVKSLVSAPDEIDTLWLEIGFAVSLVLLVAAQLRPGGDVAVKVGMLILALPLLVHFYRDAGVRWVLGERALVSGLPERLAAFGQWSMVLAALLTPYCFAPRPFIDSAARLAPLAIGGFVGVVGALVMRQDAGVGAKIAFEGLGVDLGAGPPASQIALYLIALGTITWTLVACFISPSPARRRIGVGLGLIAAAGYGFDWPLQYLLGLVGFLTIGGAVHEVAAEERSARTWSARPHTPPVAGETWQAYVVALVEALRGRGLHASTVSLEDPALARERLPGEATADDAHRDGSRDEASRTHVLIADAKAAPVRVLIERVGGAVRLIEVVCGRDPRDRGEPPAWTLEARPERLLGRAEPPPRSAGRHVRTGDDVFDRRFHMRDSEQHGARLLDDGMRARACALLDGWLACWPGRALIYHVVPGQGAPIDNPIPLSELSARGAMRDGATDRMVTLLEFLTELSRAAVPASAPPESHDGGSLDGVPAAGEGDRYGSGEAGSQSQGGSGA